MRVKPQNPKCTYLFAVYNPRGKLLIHTISTGRGLAMRYAIIYAFQLTRLNYYDKEIKRNYWKQLYKQGYRCKKIVAYAYVK